MIQHDENSLADFMMDLSSAISSGYSVEILSDRLTAVALEETAAIATEERLRLHRIGRMCLSL